MDTEIKAKWIAALRSGKYQQTQKTLRDATGYCCLGVLCDVLGLGWEPSAEEGFFECRGSSEVLPDEALSLSGISLSAPAVQKDGKYVGLAMLNDGGGTFLAHTFAEIADLIEEQL